MNYQKIPLKCRGCRTKDLKHGCRILNSDNYHNCPCGECLIKIMCEVGCENLRDATIDDMLEPDQ